ncbi:MAG: nucleotidyltransferase domain-containing protein [Sulfurimonas sp.]|nr:nucleotidyltransferase domain-containing protein [Sulfurimonas sp.]
MRLSNRLIKLIKKASIYSFGNKEVYLFGSRVDDTKKGGDIDLAIKTVMDKKEFNKQKIKFKTFLFRQGFDLKIDLVQFSDNIDAILYDEISSTGQKINFTSY